jgi:hypothetical protein
MSGPHVSSVISSPLPPALAVGRGTFEQKLERWGWGDDAEYKSRPIDKQASRAQVSSRCAAQWDQLPSCRCTKAPHPRDSSSARIDLPTARAGGGERCGSRSSSICDCPAACAERSERGCAARIFSPDSLARAGERLGPRPAHMTTFMESIVWGIAFHGARRVLF